MNESILGFPQNSLANRLFEEGYNFSFFQAVRLLELLFPKRQSLGHSGPPQDEAVRLRAHVSLGFPPSQIFEILPPGPEQPHAALVATFFGLMGPSGILPRHYTEMLLRLQREGKGTQRTALRDWFDMFNHRLLSHFYRAWGKYRFYLEYEKSRLARRDEDLFTRALFSLVGFGTGGLRNRLHVSTWDPRQHPPERCLARVDDQVLIFYGGLFASRRRNASGLQALLADYFQLPVDVKQFQGQWLILAPENQSRLERDNNTLEVDLVLGERVWDVQSKIRIRVGPLDYVQFCDFIPERAPIPLRKAFFLLVHLVRLYVGAELSFDVQLVLRADSVPECYLTPEEEFIPQLGWNTWLVSQEVPVDVEDAVFQAAEMVWTNPEERMMHLGLTGMPLSSSSR